MEKNEMQELEARAAATTAQRKEIEAKNAVLKTIAENLKVIAKNEAENKKFEEEIAKSKPPVDPAK